MRDVSAFVALPGAAATRSSCPTHAEAPRNTTALQGLDPLKGCADQAILAKMAIKELGFPGAGHSGLLRSQGGTWEFEKAPHTTRDASGMSRGNSRDLEPVQEAAGSGRHGGPGH